MKLFGTSASSTAASQHTPQAATDSGNRTRAPRSSGRRSFGGMLSKLTRLGRSPKAPSSRATDGSLQQPVSGTVGAAGNRRSSATPSNDDDVREMVARIVSQKDSRRPGGAGTSSEAETSPTIAHFFAPELGVSPSAPEKRSKKRWSGLFHRRSSSKKTPAVTQKAPTQAPPATLSTATHRDDPVGETVSWIKSQRATESTPQQDGHGTGAVVFSSTGDGDGDAEVRHESPRNSNASEHSAKDVIYDTGPIFDESGDEHEEDDLFDLDIGPLHPPPVENEIHPVTPSNSETGSTRHDVPPQQNEVLTTSTPVPQPDPVPSANQPRSSLGKLKQLKNALKGWQTYAKDEAYIHGFGFSSTSLSLTPISTNTKTARAKPFTGVTREGDAPVELHRRLANLPGSTPPAVLHESPVVQELEAPNALDRLFLDASILPGTNRRQLFDSIKQVAAEKNLTPFEASSLAQALHIAFSRTPDRSSDAAYDPAYDAAHDAQIALQSLPQTNLLDALRDTAEPQRTPDYDADKAWALAQELVHIPGGVGTSVIEKLTPQTPRPAGTHASVVEKDRMLVSVLLKASQQVVREARQSAATKPESKILGVFPRASRQVGNAASPEPGGPRMLAHDPASIFADGALHAAIAQAGEDQWPGSNNTPVPSNLSLAQKAMLAVKDELQTIDAHVADDATRGTAFSQGTHGCRFAISMIRGDMMTDQAREPSGVRSQFQLAESRLGKSVGKHLDRAMRRPTTWTRFLGSLEALSRHVGVYKNKSPFYTYNRIAESDDGRGMGVANRGGTHAGRALYDMQHKVQTTIDERANLGEDAAAGDEEALRLMVRSSIIQTSKAETLMLPRFAQPVSLTDLSQGKVVDAVMQKLGGAGAEADAQANDALRAKVAAMVADENKPLTTQRLLQWAAAVGGPDNAGSAKEIAGAAPADHPWRAFAEAFERAEHPDEIAPIATPSLRGKSRDEVADILAKIVAAEELGSGFALDSAGNVQGTTKNVSGIISSIPLHFLGSVHADLGGGKIRTVRFESVTSTDRSQLRVSVTTLKRAQAGFGGSVGHFTSGDAPITAGGGLDVGGAYEVVHQEGAVLGFPRNLSGGVLGDRAVNEKKAQLVKLLVQGGALEGHAQPANEEDRKSLIKCAYQAFGDDLSIGFYEMDQSDKQGTLSVNGNVGIRFGDFKLGLPTLGAAGRAQGTTIRYRDQSGFLKTEWETDSSAYNASFQGSLASLNGYDQLSAGTHDLHSSITTAVAPFVSGSAQFFRFGVADRRVQIMQDGKELPTSFATRTFQAPISFLHEFGQNVDKYADDKAKKYFPKEYNAGGQSRENVVLREKTRMLEFVNHYLKERDLTSTPQLYTEFGDNVDTANKLRAAAYMAERLGKKETAGTAREEISAIHGDEKYREGRFLTNLQIEQEGKQVGINGIVGVTYARNDNRAQQVLSFT